MGPITRLTATCGFMILLSGYLAAALPVSPPPPVTGRPAIHCDEPVYDYGARSNTEDVRHTFVLRNDGDTPLVISQVRSGCGCTLAELDRYTIPPGETANLSARLSLKGYSGPKHSSLYLHSNDPSNAVFLCRFTGTAEAELELTPTGFLFNVSPESSNLTASITLLNRTPQALHITGVDRPSSCQAITVVTNEPGKRYTLTATSESPAGSVQNTLSLYTDHPRYPRLDIPFKLAVLRDLNVYPEVLEVKATAPEALLDSRFIIIQSRDNKPFTVTQYEVVPPCVPLSLHTVKPFWVRLKVGPARFAEAMTGVVVRVHTDMPRQPLIEVPIRVMPR